MEKKAVTSGSNSVIKCRTDNEIEKIPLYNSDNCLECMLYMECIRADNLCQQNYSKDMGHTWNMEDSKENQTVSEVVAPIKELSRLRKNTVKRFAETNIQVEKIEKFAKNFSVDSVNKAKNHLRTITPSHSQLSTSDTNQRVSNVIIDNAAPNNLTHEPNCLNEKTASNPNLITIRKNLNTVFQSLTKKMEEFIQEADLFHASANNRYHTAKTAEFSSIEAKTNSDISQNESNLYKRPPLTQNQNQVSLETNLPQISQNLEQKVNQAYKKYQQLKAQSTKSQDSLETQNDKPAKMKLFLSLYENCQVYGQQSSQSTNESEAKDGTDHLDSKSSGNLHLQADFDKDRGQKSGIDQISEFEPMNYKKIKSNNRLQIEPLSSVPKRLQEGFGETLVRRIEEEVGIASLQNLTPYLPAIEALLLETQQLQKDQNYLIDTIIELIKSKSTLWELLIGANLDDSALQLLKKTLTLTCSELKKLELKAQSRVNLANKSNRNFKMIILSLLSGRYAVKSVSVS